MKKLIFLLLTITVFVFSGCSEPDLPENFEFSLVWGINGISSYDSKSGKLVKTTDATDPTDYITTYILSDEERSQIYELILDLDIESYPDEYDPHNGGLATVPSMTLILSVHTAEGDKTVVADDVAVTYESKNIKGQRFLSVCEKISEMLKTTDEWRALPEYEFFYD